MSTLAYAALTSQRLAAATGTEDAKSIDNTNSYVDAFAALVPAEVLTLHAMIVSATTSTGDGITRISDPDTLFWSFFALILLSIVLYVASRIRSSSWVNRDYMRAAIPPLAFVGWTMLQRATAFDAVLPSLAGSPRTVIALFLGVILGLVAAALTYKNDPKDPPKTDPSKPAT